jgi:Glycosyltransferases involved in cell wall biogenesis
MFSPYTLTTIICCHNEQDYLEACVASLALEKHPDWEVLIVDDASRDRTYPTIKKLAKQFKNLRYFRFDTNMGLGVARNFGMLQARGKYIHFLDADDEIIEQGLASVLALHEASDVDIVQCPFIRIVLEGENLISSETGEYTGEEAFRAYILRRFGSWSACTAVYRREYLLSSGCRFQQGFYYEDVIFCCNAFYNSAKVIGHSEPFYRYRCTNPSITRGVGALGMHHTISSARMYHDVCEFFALMPDAEQYEREFALFCEIMGTEHAPRMARSLKSEELACSAQWQKELQYYLSLKPSVFTTMVSSFIIPQKQNPRLDDAVEAAPGDQERGAQEKQQGMSKNQTSPKVSIILPAFNAESFCAGAVESMLGQSFADFELLLMDDCSTDSTWEILQSFNDSRIHLFRNKENIGITASLNKMLSLSKGEYIARMDADDLSLPGRVALQVEYLDAHPDIWVCGGFYIDSQGVNRTRRQLPTKNDEIRAGLLFECNLPHPFVMLNGAKFREHGLYYDKTKKSAQDYALWLRMVCEFPSAGFANLPAVIGQYHKHDKAISTAKKGEQDKFAALSRIYALQHLGIAENEPFMVMHKYLCTAQVVDLPETMGKIFQWAKMLLETNEKRGLFDKECFKAVVQERLIALSNANPHYGELATKFITMMTALR